MDSEKDNLRFYIIARMKFGDSPMKVHQELESVNGTYCSYDTVCRWIQRVQSGKNDLRGEPRSGEPNNCHQREYTQAGAACK